MCAAGKAVRPAAVMHAHAYMHIYQVAMAAGADQYVSTSVHLWSTLGNS